MFPHPRSAYFVCKGLHVGLLDSGRQMASHAERSFEITIAPSNQSTKTEFLLREIGRQIGFVLRMLACHLACQKARAGMPERLQLTRFPS